MSYIIRKQNKQSSQLGTTNLLKSTDNYIVSITI